MDTSYRTNVVLCKGYDLVRSPIELIICVALVTRLSASGGCWLLSDSEYRKVVLSLNEGDRYGSFALVSGFRIHRQLKWILQFFIPTSARLIRLR
jgi:hypothetical protein